MFSSEFLSLTKIYIKAYLSLSIIVEFIVALLLIFSSSTFIVGSRGEVFGARWGKPFNSIAHVKITVNFLLCYILFLWISLVLCFVPHDHNIKYLLNCVLYFSRPEVCVPYLSTSRGLAQSRHLINI